MKRLLPALMLSLSVHAQANWKLVWSDEFEKPGPPDPARWGYEEGFVRNREHQWYQPGNAVCKDGFLIIEARREKRPNPLHKADARDWKASRPFIEYTSSSLTTKGKHQWQFGRFEARARIDTRQGMWPAFWTLGVSGMWPENGEIDILEFYRGMLLFNAAWGSTRMFDPVWSTIRKPLEEFNDPAWPGKFHTWRMDWDKDFIQLFVDDVLMNKVDLSKTYNGDGPRKNPFHQPHYILLNLAIGGQNGGDPTGTEFPGRLEVDYVRVYQRPDR